MYILLLLGLLGTDVAAIRSVPAALYSFLRCNKPVSSVQVRPNTEASLY